MSLFVTKKIQITDVDSPFTCGTKLIWSSDFGSSQPICKILNCSPIPSICTCAGFNYTVHSFQGKILRSMFSFPGRECEGRQDNLTNAE